MVFSSATVLSKAETLDSNSVYCNSIIVVTRITACLALYLVLGDFNRKQVIYKSFMLSKFCVAFVVSCLTDCIGYQTYAARLSCF